MTSKDRLAAAFEQREPDKIPIHHVGFSSDVASALLGREAYVGGGIQQWREVSALWDGPDAHAEFVERSFKDAMDIALLVENDFVRVSYWRYNVKPTRKLDENTFIFENGPEENWRVLRFDPPSEQCNVFPYRPQREPTFEDLERGLDAAERALPDHEPSAAAYEFELRAKRLLCAEREVRVGGAGIGIPHSQVWLEACALRPDLVARHLDLQVEYAARTVQMLTGLGFEYIWGGGDFASNAGPFYSPRVFHDLFLPRLQRICDLCHRHGARYLFASDGNLWPVADDLFGASGVDGYFEIDRRAGMDIPRLRERFPELTLIGNISSHTVHLGTREEVIAETRACLEEARAAQGVIVGVSNYFVPGTPPANLEALLEVVRQMR
jgi:hypothetical protein